MSNLQSRANGANPRVWLRRRTKDRQFVIIRPQGTHPRVPHTGTRAARVPTPRTCDLYGKISHTTLPIRWYPSDLSFARSAAVLIPLLRKLLAIEIQNT